LKLIIDFVSLLINRGLDSVIVLMLVPAFISSYGIDNYGLFSLGLSIIAFLIILIRFGFETSILRTSSSGLPQVIEQVLSAKVTILVFTCPLFLAYCHFFWPDSSTVIIISLYLIVLFEVFSLSHAFIVLKKAHILTLLGVVKFVLLLVLCTFLIDHLTVQLFTLFYALSLAAVNVIQYLVLSKIVSFSFHYEWNTALSAIKSSKHYFGSKAASLLTDKLFLIVCGFLLTPALFAKLDVALKVFSFAIMGPMILTGILLSRISNGVQKERYIIYLLVPIFLSAFIILATYFFRVEISAFFKIELVEEISVVLFLVMVTVVSLVIGELILIHRGKAKSNSISSQISLFLLLFVSLCIYFFNVELNVVDLLWLLTGIKAFEVIVKAKYAAS
tara:strand:- start:1410 stop:2576 length:1167 start_codon:yes stop_codon:yes gene_type:complete